MQLPNSTEAIWIILQVLGWEKINVGYVHSYFEKRTDPWGYKPTIKRVTLIDAWNYEQK
jgi:hypothetical protein